MEAANVPRRYPVGVQMKTRLPSISQVLLLCVLLSSISGGDSARARELVDRVVAVVNEQVVTEAELEQALSADRTYLALLEKEDGEDLRGEIRSRRLKVLNLLVERRLLVSEGRRLEIKPDMKMIEDRIQRTMQRLNLETAEEFDQVLRREGLTLDVLKGMYSDDFIEQVLLDGRVRSAISVSEAQIRSYYEKNITSFKSADRVNFAQILLKVEDFSDAAVVEAKQARADAILEQIRAGRPFKEVCEAEKDVLSSCEGLGFLGKDEMFDTLSKVAFELKIGDVSDVVRSPMGFHIIKVLDKQGGGADLGPEMRRNIKETLFAEQFDKLYCAYIKELRGKSHIKVMLSDAP